MPLPDRLDHPRFSLLRVAADEFAHLGDGAVFVRERLAMWGTHDADVTFVLRDAVTLEPLGGVHAGPARQPGADGEAWFWVRADLPDRPALEAEVETALRGWQRELCPAGVVRWLGLECDWQEWAAA